MSSRLGGVGVLKPVTSTSAGIGVKPVTSASLVFGGIGVLKPVTSTSAGSGVKPVTSASLVTGGMRVWPRPVNIKFGSIVSMSPEPGAGGGVRRAAATFERADTGLPQTEQRACATGVLPPQWGQFMPPTLNSGVFCANYAATVAQNPSL